MAKENGKFDVMGYSTTTGLYWLRNGVPEQDTFELVRNGREKVMRFSAISQQLKWLQKEVLTIAEATIEDPRKLTATKTLIKDKFSAKISWIYELCGTPEEEQDFLVDDEGKD